MNNKKVFKILKIVGSVIFYIFIAVILLFSIANLQQKNKQTYPNLFGYGFLSVQTNSMNGDKKNSFKAGDLITVKKPSNKERNNLEVGDIITFYDGTLAESDNSSNLSTFLNTHRIVYIFYDAAENVEYYVTQGDYVVSLGFNYDPDFSKIESSINETDGTIMKDDKDPATGERYQFFETVLPANIVGIYQGQAKGAGTFMANLTKPKSPLFLCLVVVPILIFFLVEVFMVIRNVLKLNNEKQKKALESDKESMLKEIEAQKEAMRQEILAQLRQEQGQPATPVQEAKDEVSEKKDE